MKINGVDPEKLKKMLSETLEAKAFKNKELSKRIGEMLSDGIISICEEGELKNSFRKEDVQNVLMVLKKLHPELLESKDPLKTMIWEPKQENK